MPRMSIDYSGCLSGSIGCRGNGILAFRVPPNRLIGKTMRPSQFPLSLRLGKLTKFGRRAVNIFVEPEYTAIHEDDIPVPEWSVRLGINLLFPEGF